MAAINATLADPSKDAAGRRRIVREICQFEDGRSGGAIGLVIGKDGTWYNPADGGCRTNEENWKKWMEAGYTSKAQADAATKK